MSVLDQVRALEQQVQQRLRELRPLVAEYRDLEQVAERLGLKRDDGEAVKTAADETAKPPVRTRKPAAGPRAKRGASARPSTGAAIRKPKAKAASKPKAAATRKKPAAARGRSAEPGSSARKRAPAAPGQRQQDVLRLVRERPGITVAALASELGVDATGLYGVVRRLQTKGQISKDGTRLRPVNDTSRTAEGATTPSSTASAEPSKPTPQAPPGTPEAPTAQS